MPRSGIAGSHGQPIFNCLSGCDTDIVSGAAASAHLAANSAEGFRFLRILTAPVNCWFSVFVSLDSSHVLGCEVGGPLCVFLKLSPRLNFVGTPKFTKPCSWTYWLWTCVTHLRSKSPPVSRFCHMPRAGTWGRMGGTGVGARGWGARGWGHGGGGSQRPRAFHTRKKGPGTGPPV